MKVAHLVAFEQWEVAVQENDSGCSIIFNCYFAMKKYDKIKEIHGILYKKKTRLLAGFCNRSRRILASVNNSL